MLNFLELRKIVANVGEVSFNEQSHRIAHAAMLPVKVNSVARPETKGDADAAGKGPDMISPTSRQLRQKKRTANAQLTVLGSSIGVLWSTSISQSTRTGLVNAPSMSCVVFVRLGLGRRAPS